MKRGSNLVEVCHKRRCDEELRAQRSAGRIKRKLEPTLPPSPGPPDARFPGKGFRLGSLEQELGKKQKFWWDKFYI